MTSIMLPITLVACASSRPPADDDQPDTGATAEQMTATLAIGDRATLADGAVTLELTDVTDSRCPRDVQCVWAGEAIAEIQVSSGDGATGVVRLSTQRGQEEVQLSDYALVLVEVEPYPQSAGTIDAADYRVQFRLEQRPADRSPGDAM